MDRCNPTQGQSLDLYLLYGNAHLEEIFTHKVQAEAHMRKLKQLYPQACFWIQTKDTVPHDNNV